MEKVKLVELKESITIFSELIDNLESQDVAVVKNLEFVNAPFELYPLAKKELGPLDYIKGIAMDMDGTSTTTEPLALHSLEYMVRKFTGIMEKSEWEGLDKEEDLPYIIGNSNFRHTEFLIVRYKDKLNFESFKKGFFEAIFWTCSNGKDGQRRKDVIQNANNCGLSDLFKDNEFVDIINKKLINSITKDGIIAHFLMKYGQCFKLDSFSTQVSAALDIYYTRYHFILHEIDEGRGQALAEQFLGSRDAVLIGPMPGFGVYLALVKGWLGDEGDSMYELLKELWIESSHHNVSAEEVEKNVGQLNKISYYFKNSPSKLSLVTASILYEAHIVMTQVFKVIKHQIDTWPISKKRIDFLKEKFSDYNNVFDAFVTASDSSEARLKPHPDLYSISLYQMGISKENYGNCIALEDTEPGIISARGAGYGISIAMPNHDTERQDYKGASYVVYGGLPEVILKYHAFLKYESGGNINV